MIRQAIATSLVAGGLLTASPAQADTADVYTWSPTTTTVTVNAQALPRKGWRASRAIRAWSAAFAPVGITVRGVAGRADITVVPVTEIVGFPAGVAGLASPTLGPDWHLDACRIDLEVDTLRAWRPAMLVHELGHCLGLPHADHMGTVMNPIVMPSMTVPTPADLATITAAYSTTR